MVFFFHCDYYLPTARFFHRIFVCLNVNTRCNLHLSLVESCKKVGKSLHYGNGKKIAVASNRLRTLMDELEAIRELRGTVL